MKNGVMKKKEKRIYKQGRLYIFGIYEKKRTNEKGNEQKEKDTHTQEKENTNNYSSCITAFDDRVCY